MLARLGVALPLGLMLGSAVLFTLPHPGPTYRDFIIGSVVLLILGPGLVPSYADHIELAHKPTPGG
ncbi:MAG: hypothetical protein M3R21_04345 [Candidatus Dormibacteraeota bacterium]|nr:hypothetical protein [Candidatus Dormibacteraeota bacterium]